jgi:single-stranded DNA-binding protein
MGAYSFVGRLCKDAEASYTEQGVFQLKFTTAEDLGFGDSKHTWYVRWTWKGCSEKMAEFLKKGRPFMFTGQITSNKLYQAEGKEPMVSTFGNMFNVSFLPGNKEE